MNRSIQCDGIILQSSRMGDMHKRVTLLSPQLGLLSAAAFGARKSGGKLSGLAEPFVTGRFFLYANPVKDQYKIEDIRAERFFEGIKGDLARLYGASFFAELIIKTYGGGDQQQPVYRLLIELLELIEEREKLLYLLIQGSWRFLELMGYAPDLEHCVSCGRELGTQRAYLHTADHGLWCSSCFSGGSAQNEIGPGERRYLVHTRRLTVRQAMQVQLAEEAATALKRTLILFIDTITDGHLKTVRSGLL